MNSGVLVHGRLIPLLQAVVRPSIMANGYGKVPYFMEQESRAKEKQERVRDKTYSSKICPRHLLHQTGLF